MWGELLPEYEILVFYSCAFKLIGGLVVDWLSELRRVWRWYSFLSISNKCRLCGW